MLLAITISVSSILSNNTVSVRANSGSEVNEFIVLDLKEYDSLLNHHNLVHLENFIFVSTNNSKEYDLNDREGILSFITDNQSVTFEEINILVEEVGNDMSTQISPYALEPNDPLGGKWTWHLNVNWIYRSDGWNLSAYPNTLARKNLANSNSAFSELKTNYKGKISHWTNEASLKGQWTCHFIFANSKSHWNINPSIPNKSAFKWVIDKCN